MNRNYFKNKKSWIPASAGMTQGFTLIETLFAILIFSAALVSLMTIAGRGISATRSAREQVTAHYLAQEGLEIARNMRDSNFLLSGSAWDSGLNGCTTANPCGVTYGTGMPILAPCVSGCSVFESAVDGAFVDSGNGSDSGYVRTIVAEPSTGANNLTGIPDEYKITATVSWTSRTIARRVQLVTIIKKWK